MRTKILHRPSAFNYCGIGCYRKNHHCNNCVENTTETIRDGFIEGMKQCADEGTMIDILKKQKIG